MASGYLGTGWSRAFLTSGRFATNGFLRFARRTTHRRGRFHARRASSRILLGLPPAPLRPEDCTEEQRADHGKPCQAYSDARTPQVHDGEAGKENPQSAEAPGPPPCWPVREHTAHLRHQMHRTGSQWINLGGLARERTPRLRAQPHTTTWPADELGWILNVVPGRAGCRRERAVGPPGEAPVPPGAGRSLLLLPEVFSHGVVDQFRTVRGGVIPGTTR